MTIAVRQYVQVQAGGKIELTVPELTAGQNAEVIVLLDPHWAGNREARVSALRQLFKDTQALPGAQTITEAEIAAEIAAYRAGR